MRHKGLFRIKLMENISKLKMPDGFDHQAFLSIDSTNKEAMRRIEAGEGKSGLWLTATAQSGGRGRGDREWVSEPGNLYSSLIYDTGKNVYKSAQLSFVTSLAVRDTVAEFINDKSAAKCKWPNDVLIYDKKISGILLETCSTINQGSHYIIIGIGINIMHHPDATIYPTTHLNELSDREFNHVDVFNILVQKMAHWLNMWHVEGFSTIREKWLSVCKGQGDMITVRLPNEEIVGRFIDLDSDGALKLSIKDEIKLIHSGDVFFASTESE
ncbi:MAG: biotin--[acetyl-CoA-carboxylase] ligase [Kordiimonadaceae bacterium]|nr:biotin--[acetyl-CoA-carboxylase] ligase [Kordiimonadaceae bacterium]